MRGNYKFFKKNYCPLIITIKNNYTNGGCHNAQGNKGQLINLVD